MARITTLAGMETYVLTKLGSPVIQIELSQGQLDQAIEDSVQYFQTHHTGEGNYRNYFGLSITNGVSAYDVADRNIEATIDTSLTFGENGINVLFSSTHSLLYEDWVIHGGYPGGPAGGAYLDSGMALAGYEVAIQYLEDIKDFFNRVYHAQYSSARREILITPTPTATGILLVECFSRETAENLYNNEMVKALSVAEAKIQWGQNLRKYNMTLPSGGTINWSEILAEGREDKERLMERISGESEEPIFFIE